MFCHQRRSVSRCGRARKRHLGTRADGAARRAVNATGGKREHAGGQETNSGRNTLGLWWRQPTFLQGDPRRPKNPLDNRSWERTTVCPNWTATPPKRAIEMTSARAHNTSEERYAPLLPNYRVVPIVLVIGRVMRPAPLLDCSVVRLHDSSNVKGLVTSDYSGPSPNLTGCHLCLELIPAAPLGGFWCRRRGSVTECSGSGDLRGYAGGLTFQAVCLTLHPLQTAPPGSSLEHRPRGRHRTSAPVAAVGPVFRFDFADPVHAMLATSFAVSTEG